MYTHTCTHMCTHIHAHTQTTHSEVRDCELKIGETIHLVNELKPIKLGYKIHFSERDIFEVHPELKAFEKLKIFTGESCITDFFRDFKHVTYLIQEKIRKVEPMQMTPADLKAFRTATHCCICRQPYRSDKNHDGTLKDGGLKHVRHHNHLSGAITMRMMIMMMMMMRIIIKLIRVAVIDNYDDDDVVT